MGNTVRVVCLITFLSALLIGCGSRGDLASVRGKITLDGEPLGNAFVVFAPTKKGTMAFWDTYLKGSGEARAYLSSESLSKLSGGAVHLEHK
jgi:hypothetical protein